MKRIFVGNLDSHTTEDEVYQLFAASGPVDRVEIVGLFGPAAWGSRS